jgi:hypothetical protein
MDAGGLNGFSEGHGWQDTREPVHRQHGEDLLLSGKRQICLGSAAAVGPAQLTRFQDWGQGGGMTGISRTEERAEGLQRRYPCLSHWSLSPVTASRRQP